LRLEKLKALGDLGEFFLGYHEGFAARLARGGQLCYSIPMRHSVVILVVLSTVMSTQAVGKTVECYCTDKAGNRVELGETRCMNVGGRMFTARCEMSLNVPMWREQQGGCLTG